MPGSGLIAPVWKIQPSSGTPSRKNPSSAAMYGAAKKSAIAPTTSRARSPATLVRGRSGLPCSVAQRLRPTASATPATASPFDHFGSRSPSVWTPGQATVAHSAAETIPSTTGQLPSSRSTTIGSTATAASAAEKLRKTSARPIPPTNPEFETFQS